MTDTNAQLVARAGQALYGERDWQSPLARALGVNLRTVQRVAKAAEDGEDYAAARAWLSDLAHLLDARGVEVARVAEALRARA